MATIAALGGLAVSAYGAYSANKNAKAANKPRTSETNQTTTNRPYLDSQLQPGIDSVLARQQALFDQGPNYIGGPGGGGGKAKPGNGVPKNPKNRTAAQAGKGAGGPRGTSNPTDIFAQTAQRGLDAGNTRTIQQGRNAMENILGAAGGGGPEDTGFEGYNPILDRLTQRLEGEDYDSRGRIAAFLDDELLGTGAVAPASGGGGSKYGGGRQAGFSGAGGGGYGGVGDATGNGLFGTEARKMFDETANDAELQDLIDRLSEDYSRAFFRQAADLDAQAQGTGRLGGDSWKAMTNDARSESMRRAGQTAAQVRVGDREARRQAKLGALGQVNARDIAAMQNATAQAGISASSGASSAALASQEKLANRAQTLQALGMLQDADKFGLGQLSSIGGQLSSDRLSTLGLIPGLEGVGLQGLDAANAAGAGMVNLRGIQSQAGIARAGLNQQAQMFNASQAQNQVNDYMRTLLGIGSMGGTSTTQGTNVVPGAGIDATGAGISAGLGTAATLAGLYGQYNGARAGGGTPVYDGQGQYGPARSGYGYMGGG